MAEKKLPPAQPGKIPETAEKVATAVETAKDQVGEVTEKVQAKRRTLDVRIFQLINSVPHSQRDDLVVSVISDLGQGMGWWGASAWLGATGGWKGVRAGLATTAASIGATYLVQERIKPVFRRNRPFMSREAIVVGIRPSDHSFPSGHSAASFAAAHALAHFYPRQRLPLYAVAGLVAISRIRVGHHFPSDVAVGAAIGLGVGELCYRIANLGRR